MSDSITVAMPHLGSGVTVEAQYEEPLMGELEELDNTIGKPLASARIVLRASIKINGKTETPAWWKALPKSVHEKLKAYLEECMPEEAEGQENPLAEG